MAHKPLKTRDIPLTLSQQAYLAIRDGILRGKYPMGARLPRRRIAAELGMSLLPVSDAIQRLQSEGLVESQPRVGTVVKIPTPKEIEGHYVVREALESQAARLFSQKATPDDRAQLQRIAETVDDLFSQAAEKDVNSNFLFEAQVQHLRLHMHIAECTRCAELCEAIERNQVLVFNWLYSRSARIPLPPDWHKELVRAVASADPLLADEAMRRHVAYGLDLLLRWLDREFAPSRSSLVSLLTNRTDPSKGSPKRERKGSKSAGAAR